MTKFLPFNYYVVFHHIAYHTLFIHSLHDVCFKLFTIISSAKEYLSTHLFFSNKRAISRNYNSDLSYTFYDKGLRYI